MAGILGCFCWGTVATDKGIEIHPLGEKAEAAACAVMMASAEPGITLKRDYSDSLIIVLDRSREVTILVERWQQPGYHQVHQDGAAEIEKSHCKSHFTGYGPDTLTNLSSLKCWIDNPVDAQS